MSFIDLERAADILSASERILILTHTRPDADTLGSGTALSELLSGLGKTAIVINDDDIPKRLRFITEKASLRPEEVIPEGFEADLVVSVDVSASKLLGMLE